MKGIDYVAIDPRIANDEKVVAIATALKKDRYAIAGRFPVFLGEVARHAHDGNLSPFSDATLDAWADGLRGFGAQVRANLCGSDGRILSWEKYNGRALGNLQKDRDRKREYREEQRRKLADRRAAEKATKSEDGPENVRGRSEPGPALTDTDTDTASSSKKEQPRNNRREPIPNERKLRLLLPIYCHEALRTVLLESGRGAEGAAMAMCQMLDTADGTTGPGGSPVTPDELAHALQRNAGMPNPGWNGGGFVRADILRQRQPVAAPRTPEPRGARAPRQPAPNRLRAADV